MEILAMLMTLGIFFVFGVYLLKKSAMEDGDWTYPDDVPDEDISEPPPPNCSF